MGTFCSICQSSISENENTHICDECGTHYHLECWQENSGCATYGCANTSVSPKLDYNDTDATQDNLKNVCPICKEEIDFYNERCPQCGSLIKKENSQVSGQEKVSIGDYKPGIFILIFAMLGITAPFALLLGGMWYFQKKEMIKNNNPLLNFLTLLGLSISALYVILFFILVISN